jgi:hypothetical protein
VNIFPDSARPDFDNSKDNEHLQKKLEAMRKAQREEHPQQRDPQGEWPTVGSQNE